MNPKDIGRRLRTVGRRLRADLDALPWEEGAFPAWDRLTDQTPTGWVRRILLEGGNAFTAVEPDGTPTERVYVIRMTPGEDLAESSIRNAREIRENVAKATRSDGRRLDPQTLDELADDSDSSDSKATLQEVDGTIWLTAWNPRAHVYLSYREDERGIHEDTLTGFVYWPDRGDATAIPNLPYPPISNVVESLAEWRWPSIYARQVANRLLSRRDLANPRSIVVQVARPGDVQAIHRYFSYRLTAEDLELRFVSRKWWFLARPEVTPEDVARAIDRDRVLVLRDTSGVIGELTWSRSASDDRLAEAYLSVAKDRRGPGALRALLRTGLEDAWMSGVTRVRVTTDAGNAPVVRWLARWDENISADGGIVQAELTLWRIFSRYLR